MFAVYLKITITFVIILLASVGLIIFDESTKPKVFPNWASNTIVSLVIISVPCIIAFSIASVWAF